MKVVLRCCLLFKMRTLDVFIALLFGFIAAQSTKTTRDGTILFMKAGTNMSLSELFYSTNHTDTTNLNKHLWTIDYLMNGSNFRSPILDYKDELNLTRYDVVTYNAAGEIMTSFQFEDGIDGYISTHGTVEFSELYNSTSLALFGDVDTDKGRFVSTNVQAPGPRGSQFIFSTDEGFHDLPTDVNAGCFRFTAGSLFTTFSETFEIEGGEDCVRYCITVPESTHAVAFTANITNTITHRCACLKDLFSAISIFGPYNETLCPDDSECGCAIYQDETFVYGSVYTMNSTNQFLDQLMNQNTATYSYILSTSYPYIYQSRRYVTEIRFTASNFTYTLGFSSDSVTCGTSTTFSFYGQHLGSARIFDAGIPEPIQPTPATCLYINILTAATVGDHNIKITYITDTFTTAEYLQIVGHWTEVECEFNEVLHNASIIQGGWINVVQMNSPSSLMHGNNITFPEMSKNVMSINVSTNASRFFVLRGVTFMSDVDAVIVTTISTNTTCVEIGYGTKISQDYTRSFTFEVNKNTLETLTIGLKCADRITFTGRVKQTSGSVNPRVHHVEFTIKGCVLKEPSLNAPCDNGDITAQVLLDSDVQWIWVTNEPLVASYIRPGGPGVVLYRYTDPWIRILLDEKHIPIEVKRVKITGDINQAVVTIGGVETFLDNTTAPMLDYKFTDRMRGHEIKIDRIFGRTDMDHDIYDFLIIKLSIGICSLSLHHANSSANATTNSTLQNTQNSSMSTLLTPAHNTSSPVNTTTSTLAVNTSTSPAMNTSTSPAMNTTTLPAMNTSTSPAMNTSTSTVMNTSTPTTSSHNTTLAGNISTPSVINTTTSPALLQEHNLSTPIVTENTSNTQTLTSPGSASTTTLANPPTQPNTNTTTATKTTTISSPTIAATTTTTTTSTTSTLTTSQNVTSTSTTPSVTQPPPPSQQTSSCCVCFNDSVNITKEEIDTMVQQLVRNLTVPKRKTSAFKRTKESAPDQRTSAKMVGTVGIAMMTVTAGLIVAMDYTYIVQIFKFGRHVIRRLFLR